MAAISKRARLEALGWKFVAIPRLMPEGMLNNPKTGWISPAYYDHKTPEAWIAIPPDGHPAKQRRFENHSPIRAIVWAFEQQNAPQIDAALGGVAALTQLMSRARSSGLVIDGADEAPPLTRPRPDAELISLCREAMGCERIADTAREGRSCPWTERASFKADTDRMSEAYRAKDKIAPQIVDLAATTGAGILAKAHVVGTLFRNTSGLRGAAVRSLVKDLVAVLERDATPSPEPGRTGA